MLDQNETERRKIQRKQSLREKNCETKGIVKLKGSNDLNELGNQKLDEMLTEIFLRRLLQEWHNQLRKKQCLIKDFLTNRQDLIKDLEKKTTMLFMTNHCLLIEQLQAFTTQRKKLMRMMDQQAIEINELLQQNSKFHERQMSSQQQRDYIILQNERRQMPNNSK